MVEVTTPVIDPSEKGAIRYDTVDPEKGTISSGYVNPEANKPKDHKGFLEKYGPRAWLQAIKTGLGLNSPWTAEEQAKLDDLKARQNQTVGDVKSAQPFKASQEKVAKQATTPPVTWQSKKI